MRSQPFIVVGIPARNEELLVENAVRSVLASADRMVDPQGVRIVVACDSCVDDTAAIVRSIAVLDDRVDVIEGEWRSAGAARAAAIDRAMGGLLDTVSALDIWVATTDADTTVPPDWLTTHADCWAGGDHAVAGIIDVVDDHERPHVRAVFGRHYTVGHDSHTHVHGANLGVRADAYLSVGGFSAVDLAEDHALWHDLRHAGFTCRPSVALHVVTSARLKGRAVGGFADTMRRLVAGAGLVAGDDSTGPPAVIA